MNFLVCEVGEHIKGHALERACSLSIGEFNCNLGLSFLESFNLYGGIGKFAAYKFYVGRKSPLVRGRIVCAFAVREITSPTLA